VKGKIHVVVGDYAESLAKERNQRYDALVSNEFLSELDFNEMKGFLSDCYRILKQDGITIQSFLSPEARNPRQKLLIEADSNPRWTKFPPKEWFSPPPELVVSQLKTAGFGRIRVASMRSNLVFKADAARSVLGNWGVDYAFWESHENRLVSRGLEIPDWVVVAAVKPRSGNAIWSENKHVITKHVISFVH
jgi:hypothetical protein